MDNSVLTDEALLSILLLDRTRSTKRVAHNIIWATDNYLSRGRGYSERNEIALEAITGPHSDIIQPRISKTKEEQQSRARDKGEVFSPSWICNKQNNLIDNEWFGISGLFNEETETGWNTNPAPIPFPTKDGKTWQDYVSESRLEITCGEAPYLCSRYDAITGVVIPVKDRIGILDRKLRVAAENTSSQQDWYAAAKQAFQSTYGFEWQGDSLLLARENALLTFIDYYDCKFSFQPGLNQLTEIAEVISWNLWQMDGLKGTVPDSCHDDIEVIPSLFGGEERIVKPCAGCQTDDMRRHNGIYCKIMDWEAGKAIRFIDLIKE